jgi:predicted permease
MSVSHSNFPPLTLNDWGSKVRLENAPETERFRVNIQFVGPNYFSTMGIKLLGGREFRQDDRKDSPKVVIINETFAKQYFPGQDPVGMRLFGATKPIEIVGLVSNSKYRTLGEESRSLMYQPYQQGGDFWGGNNFCLLVRTEGLPITALSTVKNRLTDLDPSASVDAKTMQDNLSSLYAPSRMGAVLLGCLAALSLLLTVVGLYGVIAYTVDRRTPEFGIRIALGASQAQILRLVVTDGLVLIGIGGALGVAVSLAATRVLVSLLAVGISNTDTLSFIGTILLLGLMGLGSNLIAARKALTVDPMVALRYE